MGATTFHYKVPADRRRAETVFRELQEECRLHYGSDGYTGTIAESDGFVDLTSRFKGRRLRNIESEILDTYDKFGPCGMVKRAGHYHFIGGASE